MASAMQVLSKINRQYLPCCSSLCNQCVSPTECYSLIYTCGVTPVIELSLGGSCRGEWNVQRLNGTGDSSTYGVARPSVCQPQQMSIVAGSALDGDPGV